MANARTSTSELLRVARENPAALVEDPNKELRSFRVSAVSTLGTKRGTGRGSFIDSVLAASDGFYASVLQNLRPWVPKAPQLPQGPQTAAEAEGLDLSVNPSDLVDPPADETAAFDHDEDQRDQAVDADADDPDEVRENHDAASDLEPVSPAPTALLEWDQALYKLERERDLSLDGGLGDPAEPELSAEPYTPAADQPVSWEPGSSSSDAAEDVVAARPLGD